MLQKEFMPLQDAKNAPPAHQRRIGHAVELSPHFAYGRKGILSHQTENPGVEIGGRRIGIFEEWNGRFVARGGRTVQRVNDRQPGYFPAFFFGCSAGAENSNV